MFYGMFDPRSRSCYPPQSLETDVRTPKPQVKWLDGREESKSELRMHLTEQQEHGPAELHETHCTTFFSSMFKRRMNSPPDPPRTVGGTQAPAIPRWENTKKP